MSPNDQEQTHCGGDSPTKSSDDAGDLKASEVTELSDWTPSSPSFFESTTKSGEHFGFEHSFFKLDQLPIKFAGYTLLKKIGEGGAGIVFLANPDPENSACQWPPNRCSKNDAARDFGQRHRC